MKALPKLSKAQQEAWNYIMKSAAKNGNFDSRGYRTSLLGVLTAMGMLTAKTETFGTVTVTQYAIHPDYLPASEPAALESEPETVAEDAPRFKVGDRVIPLIGNWQELECEVYKIFVDMSGITRIMIQDVLNRRGVISYKESELELYDPETVGEDRPTVDEARLIETVNELKARVDELEAENQLLYNKQQVMTLRIERLKLSRDMWSAKYVQVVKEKQESEAKHE